MRLPPRAAPAIAALLGLTALGCAPAAEPPFHGPAPTGTPSPAASGLSWIVTAGAIGRLRQAGLPASLLQADFDQPATLLLVQQGRPVASVPRASLAFVFPSSAGMVQALRSGAVPPAVRWLVLDLEDWPLTPPDEQRDPIGALTRAVAAAHQVGKRVIFTPAVDLLSILEPHRVPPWPARYTGAPAADFERLVVQPGAAISDAFEVQSQETEATAYATTFAPQMVAAARAAHPGAKVLVGLSTNPNGRQVTPADLSTLQRAAAAAGASGYWLNIPQAGSECPLCGAPQPQVAVQFLEALGPMGTSG